MQFQRVENKHPPFNTEVIGYSKEWIDKDYNPDGMCVCFLFDDGVTWAIAKWCGDHDEWHTRMTDEEGEGNNRYENIILPPTHWIHKPKFS